MMMALTTTSGASAADLPVSGPRIQIAQAAPINFDIPAQPLAAALTRFGQQSGLQVTFDPALVAGLTSQPVTGQTSPDQALTKLLTGTGVGYRYADDRTVVLQKLPAGAAQTIQLPPVAVRGQGETGTGPVDGYVATRSVSGTKTDTPILETPQTINVVTRDQMDAQGAQSVRDALRYTPGVVSEPRGIQSYADTLYSRGFAIDEYWDGMKLLVGNFAVPQIEEYNLERIEILKGPGSVLYGQASPGGLANLVSKRPTEEPYHSLELTGGSYGHIQGAFDFSGPLDQEGTLLYRVTGIGRDTGTQVNHTEEERYSLSPALTWKPTDSTSITFLTNIQRDPEGGYSGFLPADGSVFKNAQGKRFSQSFFDGSTDFNTFKRTQASAGYLFEHKFDDDWTVRQNVRYIHTNVYYENAFSFGYDDAAETTLDLFARRSRERLDAVTTDNQVEKKLSTGPVDHTLLAGLDYQWLKWRQHSGGDFVGTLSVTDPDNNQDISKPPYDTLTYQTQNQLGVYGQDQLRWDRWRLLLGGRYDWADTQVDDKVGGTNKSQPDHDFTGRAGLLYLFDAGFAPYISYSTSFQPAIGVDADGNAFKPTKGEQEEVGIKYQPKGSDSFITVSAYNLTQKNVLTTDPSDPTFSTQIGKVRTRGVEVEGKANLTDGLNIIASYAYMDTKVLKSSDLDETEGKTPVFIPKHAASMWVDYAFGEGTFYGLGLGAGVRYVGKTFGDAQNTFKVQDYTLFDAAISYDFGAVSPKLNGARLAVNMTNIADKRYVSGCVNTLFCTYGEGRDVLATLSYQW